MGEVSPCHESSWLAGVEEAVVMRPRDSAVAVPEEARECKVAVPSLWLWYVSVLVDSQATALRLLVAWDGRHLAVHWPVPRLCWLLALVTQVPGCMTFQDPKLQDMGNQCLVREWIEMGKRC